MALDSISNRASDNRGMAHVWRRQLVYPYAFERLGEIESVLNQLRHEQSKAKRTNWKACSVKVANCLAIDLRATAV
eukprot:11325496-Karenia_brevis.AAC.1